MSAEAAACPHCGKPNKTALHAEQNTRQGVGCALIVIGAIVGVFVSPLIAGVIFVVGLVLFLLNTRFM